jgi:hypothetical protein
MVYYRNGLENPADQSLSKNPFVACDLFDGQTSIKRKAFSLTGAPPGGTGKSSINRGMFRT